MLCGEICLRLQWVRILAKNKIKFSTKCVEMTFYEVYVVCSRDIYRGQHANQLPVLPCLRCKPQHSPRSRSRLLAARLTKLNRLSSLFVWEWVQHLVNSYILQLLKRMLWIRRFKAACHLQTNVFLIPVASCFLGSQSLRYNTGALCVPSRKCIRRSPS